jgi:uncharacterized protein YecT (DUF1311 family)
MVLAVLAVLAVVAGTALKPPVIHEVFTPQPCPMHPVSTLDIEGCAEQSIVKTDRTINADVKTIFKLLAPSARAGFVAGERAWLRYRKLSCEAESSKFAGGTFAGVVEANCAAARNSAHVKDLAEIVRDLRR